MKPFLCAALFFLSAAGAFAGELQEAAGRGDLEKVRALLQANPASVSARQAGTTALHEATRAGHLEVVKLLVASGADVNVADFSGLTPLRLALGRRQSAIADFLRQHGGVEKVEKVASAPPPANTGNVPSAQNPRAALFATNANAASRLAPPANATPPANGLVQAPVTNAAVSPAPTNRPPTERELLPLLFPIHEAARVGEVEHLKLLFKNSPEIIEATDEKGYTPLHVAALNRQFKAAEALVGMRAKVNAKSSTGETPLHMAARRGDVAIATLLLTNRAAVDARDNFGHTPLLLALQSASSEALTAAGTLAASNGVAPNAVKGPQQNMTDLLLRARAEVSERNAALVRLLLSAGANPNVAETSSGRTPLHIAAAFGHDAIVEALVRHRAALDAVDKRGETALGYALREARTNTIARLRAAGATTGRVRALNPTEQSLVEFYQRTEATLQRASGAEKARILIGLNPSKVDCERMFPKHGAQAWKVVDEINRQIRQAFARPVRDADEGREIWRVLPEGPSVNVQDWRGRGALATDLPVLSLVVEKLGATARPGDYCFVNGHWVSMPPLRRIAAQIASLEEKQK